MSTVARARAHTHTRCVFMFCFVCENQHHRSDLQTSCFTSIPVELFLLVARQTGILGQNQNFLPVGVITELLSLCVAKFNFIVFFSRRLFSEISAAFSVTLILISRAATSAVRELFFFSFFRLLGVNAQRHTRLGRSTAAFPVVLQHLCASGA